MAANVDDAAGPIGNTVRKVVGRLFMATPKVDSDAPAVTRVAKCFACGGSGAIGAPPRLPMEVCWACLGDGVVTEVVVDSEQPRA